MNPSSIRNFSLSSMQGLNANIYLIQNDRNFETSELVSRLHSYFIVISKAVRRKKTDHTGYHLSMALSWSLALANRLHINLDDELWKRFPGFCPYCAVKECICGEERPNERSQIMGTHCNSRPGTLAGFQKMLASIYPKNILAESTMHLGEEVGELDQALEHFLGTHEKELFEKIVEELVDVVTHLCAIATLLQLNLALEMEESFENGCPKCRKTPCDEGFVTSKVM